MEIFRRFSGARKTPNAHADTSLTAVAEGLFPEFDQIFRQLDLSTFERTIVAFFKNQQGTEPIQIQPEVQRLANKIASQGELALSVLNPEQKTTVAFLAEDTQTDKYTITAEYILHRLILAFVEIHFGLDKTSDFATDDPNCFIALTENGSLLFGTPPEGEGRNRKTTYTRIPSRMSGTWLQEDHQMLDACIKEMSVGEAASFQLSSAQYEEPFITSRVASILKLPAARREELIHIATRTGALVRDVTDVIPREPQKS